MPLAALRPVRAILARRIWRQIRPAVINTITRLMADGFTREEARDFALEQAGDLLPLIAPVILKKAEEAGERLDKALTWDWMNPDAKEWAEAHDDIGPLLRAAADLALDLLGDRLEAGRSPAPLR